jgi:hypothetical protein
MVAQEAPPSGLIQVTQEAPLHKNPRVAQEAPPAQRKAERAFHRVLDTRGCLLLRFLSAEFLELRALALASMRGVAV